MTTKAHTIFSYVTTLLLGAMSMLVFITLLGGAVLMSDEEIVKFYTLFLGL